MLAAALSEWATLVAASGGALAALIGALNARAARRHADETKAIGEDNTRRLGAVQLKAEDVQLKVENGQLGREEGV